VVVNSTLEDSARILIVDDDRTMRLLLRHALERDGYSVEEAGDGLEALALFTTCDPDIVLMDAAMPEMDGFLACESLQDVPGGKDTPVLMITGLDDDASVERAFAAGASDYITKPVNWAVLRQRVRRMVNERRAERHVNFLAYHDSLTGLPNRTLFIERLEHHIARARRGGAQIAVLFMDLDGFKLINDSLGHDVGDLLLKAVSDRLTSVLRESDTVARLGGDEFTAIVSDVDSEGQISTAARRVLAELTAPVVVNGQEVFVGASIGIAVYPNDGHDVRTLLRSADMAMYRAKELGRNNYQFYTPDMGDRVLARMSLESSVRRALDRKEFTVFYQPIIDLASGQIRSLEALVRWLHPELGLVPPADFIPLAEETGLIIPLGAWIFEHVCEQVAAWRDAGISPPPIAVNMSSRQLNDNDLVETMRAAMRAHRLEPGSMTLELTENSVMQNLNTSVDMLRSLRELGLALAIDDFGTGYSSLSYLTRLPIDTLKIDRSFVQHVPGSAENNAIVEAVIALAHSLRFQVVAEGVEEEAQLEYLRNIGCDAVQGYLCGRPAGAADTLTLLQHKRVGVAA
jgi:diguanylate cyclase (GGDEF)-like protein